MLPKEEGRIKNTKLEWVVLVALLFILARLVFLLWAILGPFLPRASQLL